MAVATANAAPQTRPGSGAATLFAARCVLRRAGSADGGFERVWESREAEGKKDICSLFRLIQSSTLTFFFLSSPPRTETRCNSLCVDILTLLLRLGLARGNAEEKGENARPPWRSPWL